MKTPFNYPESNIPPHYQHSLSKFLPSKKIQVVILVIILLSVVYFFRKEIIALPKKVSTAIVATTITIPEPVVQQNNTTLSIDRDTDGDGIYDWQETLIGSDALTPNAPGEIPNEVITLIQSTTDAISLEDKLALSIYERSQNNPIGNSYTENLQAAASKEILDLANSLDQKLTTYTIKDLALDEETPELPAQYFMSVAQIINSAQINNNTLQTIYSGLLNKDQNLAQYKNPLIINLRKLLSMNVPSDFIEIHLSMVNSIAKMIDVLDGKVPQSDSEMLSYVATLIFQKNLNLFLESSKTLVEINQLNQQ